MTKKTAKTEQDFSKDLAALPTTSAKIRFLASKDMPRGQIAKTLDIRYQHVRNVLITPVKNPRT